MDTVHIEYQSNMTADGTQFVFIEFCLEKNYRGMAAIELSHEKT